MRQLRTSPENTLVLEQRTSSPVPMSPPGSPITAASKSFSQQYLEMQRGLINLHRMGAIVPTVKILDGEIVKLDDIPVAGGTYSDIWLGRWFDEEKVLVDALLVMSRLTD
jgi:hypothetical protein